MGVVVGQFENAAAGHAAFETISDWVRDCAWDGRGLDGSSTSPVPTFSAVDGADGQGWTALIVYEEEPAADPDAAVFDAHAVGLSADGTRVVLVSERILGQDYNAPPDEAPITVRLEQVLRSVS